MKKIIIASSALLVATAVAGIAKEIRFSTMKQAQPVQIPLPSKGEKEAGKAEFDTASLLTAKRAADRFHRLETQNWTTLTADTAGTVALNPIKTAGIPGAEGATLYVLATRIAPERYVKGKLAIETEAMAEVFVGGESKIKKSKAGEKPAEESAQLELAPAVTQEIEVHLLSTDKEGKAPTVKLRFIPEKDFENINIAEGPATPRRFSLATTTEGDRIMSTSMSPDGKYVIVSHRETYGENDTRSWSELHETASDRTVTPDLPQGARWMPTGSTLYYTERTSDGNTLYTMPASTLTRSLAAADIPVTAAEINFAPDGRWFAYQSDVKGKKEEGVMKRVESPDDRIPGNRDRYYLMKYDLASGVSTQLTYGGPSTYFVEIAPDSKRLLYYVNKQTPDRYPFYAMTVVELDVNTLRGDTLINGAGAVNGVTYSPDGKQLLVWGGPEEFDGIGKNAGNHEIANAFDIQAYILDKASRKARALTRDFNPSISGDMIWNRSDGQIYFRGADGFYCRLYTLNPQSGAIKELPVKTDFVNNFSMGRDQSRYLTYVGGGYETVGQSWTLAVKSGKNTLIADPMGKEMADTKLGNTTPWKFTSKDGDVIDGTLTLPPDFDATKKYPLIVYYYGGTTPSNRTMHHPYTPQLFASRGYVVYVINPSGTIGYGQEFSARHVNAWGKGTADEIIEGTKLLCKEHSFIDPKKIGCLGASYGGFMTQLLQTKTDIFTAAVSHAGISNVTSYWGEGYWGYSYNSVAAAKSYPWSDPELFTKQGSLFNADKIHTPLLLLHGTRDTNVPIGESIQLFNALKILGRQVEFITVEDQDHVITDYDKRKLWQATIMAWFAKWLQDDPKWWDSMYGK